jgi:SnoaL-like domain
MRCSTDHHNVLVQQAAGPSVMGDTDDINQLTLRERQASDRGWWHRMRTAYTSDATVAVSWFAGSATEFIVRCEHMAANGDQMAHRLAPPVIDIANDRAIAEVPVAIELRAEIGCTQADLVSYTRLLYRAIRDHERWLLISMLAIHERDTLISVVSGAVPTIDEARWAAHRPPLSLAGLSLAREGLFRE